MLVLSLHAEIHWDNYLVYNLLFKTISDSSQSLCKFSFRIKNYHSFCQNYAYTRRTLLASAHTALLEFGAQEYSLYNRIWGSTGTAQVMVQNALQRGESLICHHREQMSFIQSRKLAFHTKGQYDDSHRCRIIANIETQICDFCCLLTVNKSASGSPDPVLSQVILLRCLYEINQIMYIYPSIFHHSCQVCWHEENPVPVLDANCLLWVLICSFYQVKRAQLIFPTLPNPATKGATNYRSHGAGFKPEEKGGLYQEGDAT